MTVTRLQSRTSRERAVSPSDEIRVQKQRKILPIELSSDEDDEQPIQERIKRKSTPIEISSDEDTETETESEDDEDEDEDLFMTVDSMFTRFCSALFAQDLSKSDFYHDLYMTKLSPALTRGFQTDSTRLDQLVRFIHSSNNLNRLPLGRMKIGTCDLCLLTKTLSEVFVNDSGEKYRVGKDCAKHLSRAIHSIQHIQEFRQEMKERALTMFDTLNHL